MSALAIVTYILTAVSYNHDCKNVYKINPWVKCYEAF
jgi:hypothetical protein